MKKIFKTKKKISPKKKMSVKDLNALKKTKGGMLALTRTDNENEGDRSWVEKD